MTATETAALIAAIAGVVAVVLLASVLVSITRTLKELRAVVDLLRSDPAPSEAHLGPVGSALAAVEPTSIEPTSIKATPVTASPASRVAYRAFGNPLIKGLALASGTSRAVRSLRQRPSR